MVEEIIKYNCDVDGYPNTRINLESIILKLKTSTEIDILNIIDEIEKVNSHNIQVYMNTYFNKQEAIKHSDNIQNTLSKGTKHFISLKRMSEGK